MLLYNSVRNPYCI